MINHDGVCLPLSLVAQGSNAQQRNGDKVTGTSLEISYTSHPDSPGVILGYLPQRVFITRVIIFVWKDDTVPTPSDILDTPIFTTLPAPIGPLDHDRKVKRKLLYDKTHSQFADFSTIAGSGFLAGSDTPIITRRFSIDLTKLRGTGVIHYQGSSLVAVNTIYVLLITNVSAVAAPLSGWNFEMSARYNYVDV